ncbi:MAG TPA: DHA2 family efflux MFS transporter permease subunit, partial [Bacillota bacterium]|nr:DHA2 family efflux MFS transporter permease subunit [Bacillota bacterium]
MAADTRVLAVIPGAGSAARRGPGRAAPSAPEDPAPIQNWGVPMVALVVGAFMALMDSSIVNVAIPTMEHVFGVDTAQVEWVVTIYLLALGVVVPASGYLGDRLGFKRLYLLSLALFLVGSGLCAISGTLPVLIAARVVQALGGGMIMPTTMSMVYRLIPRDKLGVASGFFGMSMLLAPALGPTLGGYLVEFVNWRWIFTVNLPIGALGLILAAAVLPEFRAHDAGRFDAWGFVTSAGGLFTVLLGLSEGSTWGWTSEPVTFLFFASGVLLIAFTWIELSVARPLLDLRVFRYASFTASILFVVGLNIALFAGAFFIPVFLQLVRGMGALQTGLILMPGALATGVMMPVAGRLYDRIGPIPGVAVGTVVLVLGTYLLHNMSLTTPSGSVIWWMVIRGLGMGMAMMPATTAGMSVIPHALVGRASAINNIVMRVAGSLGIAILTVVLDSGVATRAAALSAQYAPGSLHAFALQQALGRPSAAAGAVIAQVSGYIAGLAFTRS